MVRITLAASTALALLSGSAFASTYQLTYTGHRLTKTAPYKPIHGVKYISLTISSATPFPKGTCFDVPVSELTSLTDGVDTLASLAAAGYTIYTGSEFNLCTDATGKHIVGWSVILQFAAASQIEGRPDSYDAGTLSQPNKDYGYYDLAEFDFPKHDGRYTTEWEQNGTTPGAWKFSVVP